jgi:predicted pyridoxine 5'-phosphate oxidase superfamily flavin-nucleotide-binding protein
VENGRASERGNPIETICNKKETLRNQFSHILGSKEHRMTHKYLEIASTPAVKAVQAQNGSRVAYSRQESGEVRNDRLGADEVAFLAARDGFYLGSVSSTGWPYIQYRGGPAGFLHVLDERHIAWAELGGNRQYITTGNLAEDGRVSLFLMDYAERERLKLFGRATVLELAADPVLAARLTAPLGKARVERMVLVEVEAFDWNCPQHITPRFTAAEWKQRDHGN